MWHLNCPNHCHNGFDHFGLKQTALEYTLEIVETHFVETDFIHDLSFCRPDVRFSAEPEGVDEYSQQTDYSSRRTWT